MTDTATTAPTITTAAGAIRGSRHADTVSFKGVRYAAPPVGPLRFAPPAPVQPWLGIVDATDFGPSSPQPPERPAGWDPEPSLDEDCLFLNVYAPAAEPTGPDRPVLIWLHGGGFTVGSGSWPLYDGANLARRGDAVIVTVNHRLGLLGYLDLSSLDPSENAQRSANAGMLDLVAALEWVRDNIAAVGGDAGNVTIFGESGGGAKVGALMAMPAAAGLFHRAIVQSGPLLELQERASSTSLTAKVVAELGPDLGDVSPLDALRAASVDEILRIQGAVATIARRNVPAFAPVLDGADATAHPGDAIADGSAPDVPLMIGSTFDEATLFLAGHPALRDPDSYTWDDLAGRMAKRGEEGTSLLAAYRASRPDADPLDILLAIETDLVMRKPSIELAERRLRALDEGTSSAGVWMFLFCWSAGPMRAGHGFELPFVFDNIHEPVMKPSASRQQLADEMSGAWLAFARNGDPSHAALDAWPRYDATDRATMIFDRNGSDARNDPWGAERKAWN